jgi:hypothetical protein
VPDPAEVPLTLTDEERQWVADLGKLWNRLCVIVGPEETRGPDLNELVAHIHALQQAVLSNAAGRTYPTQFRLLGRTIGSTSNE